MFARAVKQENANSSNTNSSASNSTLAVKALLRNNPLTLNASTPAATNPFEKSKAPASLPYSSSTSTSTSAGTKRKLDSFKARSNSGLSALYDVQFDENDFEDDDDLINELSNATPVGSKSAATATVKSSNSNSGSNGSGSTAQTTPLGVQRRPEPDVSYPDLPLPGAENRKETGRIVRPKASEVRPRPTMDEVAPQHVGPEQVVYPDLPAAKQQYSTPRRDPEAIKSSVSDLQSSAVPWSSSPPEHLHVTKRSKLPWGPTTNAPSSTSVIPQGGRPMSTNAASAARISDFAYTPANKTAPLWNTTASALKEEQKKHRQQVKARKGPTSDKMTTSSASHKGKTVHLSDEQRAVVKVVVEGGKSVFFTGAAGTGKSVLMGEIIRQLKAKYRREQDRVAVTASTGLAACNIEGTTLHSCAGIGLGKEDASELVKKIRKNQKAKTRWQKMKILVIDEVSMVDGALFDKLEQIARAIRNNGRPFGGIQVVITGDFFQLPPVGAASKFAFEADTWNTTIQHTILLTKVFRQADPEFAGMLNEMRLGKISPKTELLFKKLNRPLEYLDYIDATELFSTRAEVEHANSARMNHLQGEVMTFDAVDGGTAPEFTRDKILENCIAPKKIHLKKGSQVMLIKNMDDYLVNGSIGKVEAFMDEATFTYYGEHEEEVIGVDGDAARDRLRNKIYKGAPPSISRRWPLVGFTLPDGTYRQVLCQPETWKTEQPVGTVQAQRAQVPLILAWALSIHKAQGQTLDKVKVDLRRTFEKGQAYVALSRAKTQTGLQVIGFEPRKVMVHQKVLDFYAKLVTINDVVPVQSKAEIAPMMLQQSRGGVRSADFGGDEGGWGGDEEDDFESMYG